MKLSMDRFPVGLEMDISYPDFQVSLTLVSETRLTFEIKDGPFARSETVAIEVIPLGNGLIAVSWQEGDGATVVHVQDYDRRVIHSFATLPDGRFLRMTGSFTITRPPNRASDDRAGRNAPLVLDGLTSLFQRHAMSRRPTATTNDPG